MKEKGLSKGEYTKVKQAVGGLDAMLNPKCKDQGHTGADKIYC